MKEQFPKAMSDKDLISAAVAGVAAAIIMSSVSGSKNIGDIHVLLGFVTIAAVVAAYLSVARSKVEENWKAAAIIGIGVVGFAVFQLLSKLF